MKTFDFQQFSVAQSPQVFRVGTDAVLLGALCSAGNAETVLEIGTGTGIISLMVAQRNPSAQIIATDICPEAAELAQKNFFKSPFRRRLQAIHADIRQFQSQKKFDLIISNPPYFESNPSEKNKVARQQIELTFGDFCTVAEKLLAPQGMLSVILPHHVSTDFERLASVTGLFLCRKVIIRGRAELPPKRAVLEFSRNKDTATASDLIIEKAPRQFSAAYLELTKEFHLFNGKTSI